MTYSAPWEYPNQIFVVLDTRTGKTFPLIPWLLRTGENREEVSPEIQEMFLEEAGEWQRK